MKYAAPTAAAVAALGCPWIVGLLVLKGELIVDPAPSSSSTNFTLPGVVPLASPMVIVTLSAAVYPLALAGLPMIRNCPGPGPTPLPPLQLTELGKELLSVTTSAPPPWMQISMELVEPPLFGEPVT